jgi:dTMP kinase
LKGKPLILLNVEVNREIRASTKKGDFVKIHNYRGFFIDIEGLDGSGASTQARRVSKELKKLKINSYLTKEPTCGPIGQLIRKALQGKFDSLSPAAIQLLFAADRGQHLDKEIIPRLKKGQVVISDRYAWSSIAFGSVDLDFQWLLNLNRNYILPDLTIFIEVPPHVCLSRIAKERRGVELFEKREKLEQAWAIYHSLADKYWWAQIAIVEGWQTQEKVTEEILGHIRRHLKFEKLKRKRKR